jgi:hypothetical protein
VDHLQLDLVVPAAHHFLHAELVIVVAGLVVFLVALLRAASSLLPLAQVFVLAAFILI